MADEPLYHLALQADWSADPTKPYTTSTIGRSLDEEGFIHCSFRGQVRDTAARFYSGREDVVVLTIDPSRVGAPIRVEGLARGEERFPHIYGPLPREAVVAVTPLEAFDGG